MPTVPPPSRDAALETRVFWERFKVEIAAVLLIALLAIVGFGVYRLYSGQRNSAASALLGSARSTEDYQEVIARYRDTPAGADAYLLFAQAQRDEKKFADADATLEIFIAKNPDHEFVATARMAMPPISSRWEPEKFQCPVGAFLASAHLEDEESNRGGAPCL